MKIKQIKFLFNRLFSKPEAIISLKVYKHGTRVIVEGSRPYLIMGLVHLFDNKNLHNHIAEAQAFIVKRKIGIDPRQIIKQALEDAREEHARQHEMEKHSHVPSKQKVNTVN